jgi:putative flippase GtrA
LARGSVAARNSKATLALHALTHHSAVRYLATGVLNTLVGLGVIYVSMFFLGLGNAAANALGYSIGVVLSFVINKRWTFRHTGSPLSAFARFVGVVGTAYIANLATVLVLAEGLGVDRYIAQALGIPPYTAVGYLGSRYFAFSNLRRSKDAV